MPEVDAQGRGALLERSAELNRLGELIDAVGEGHGAVGLIEGEAGIGKTALLAEGCRRAAADGLRVLHARAGQLEREVGWNLVRQLFDEVIRAGEAQRRALLQGAAGLAAPALGISAGSDAGALHGLYWLTEELCEREPVVLAADDVHWGDLPSLHYLAYLAERIEDLPVLVLATIRRGEPLADPIAVIAAGPRTDAISLRELSRSASTQLARQELGGEVDERFSEACHGATRGNPFLLRALLTQLRLEGTRPTADGAHQVGQITPGSVTRSVLLRLARLDPDARTLAGAVAVLGEGGLAVAGALAGLDHDGAARAADALADAGILARGAPLQFVHALVREVIYKELPELRRGRLHRQAAELLSDAGEQERVAAQLLQTVPSGDPWVVARLRAAAGAAAAEGAPATASRLLRRAIVEPPPKEELADLLVGLGRAEAAAGEPHAAERLSEAVEIVSEPRRRAEIELDRGRLLYLAGLPTAAARAFDHGLRELAADSNPDRSLEAELQAGWLTVARLEVSLREQAEKLVHAVAADPPTGGSYGERALLAHIAGQLTFDGVPRERPIELAYRALGDGELIRQETSDGLSWVVAMGALGWADDFDGFAALQREALEDARRRGSVIGFATAMYGDNFHRYYRGMLDEAIADAEQAIAAEREGWRHFLTAARAQLAWALIEKGELEAAAGQLEQAARDPGLEQNSAQALVHEARGRIQLIRGDPAGALRSVLAAGQVFSTEARISNPSILPWRSRAAVALAATGDRDRAEELLDEELRLVRRFGAPRPIGVALMAAGVVRGVDGVEALEEAVATLESSPVRLEYARALVMLGAALRRRGTINAAREQLERALSEAETLGATLIEERARMELTAAGVRPRRRRQAAADALTAAERRVAEAAAEGKTNREIAQSLFVSRRTVETHLTHCYQKLGISGRSELAATLRVQQDGD